MMVVDWEKGHIGSCCSMFIAVNEQCGCIQMYQFLLSQYETELVERDNIDYVVKLAKSDGWGHTTGNDHDMNSERMK